MFLCKSALPRTGKQILNFTNQQCIFPPYFIQNNYAKRDKTPIIIIILLESLFNLSQFFIDVPFW